MVTGSDPPEQAPVLETIIPTITTAKLTLAIVLIVTRKLQIHLNFRVFSQQ